MLLLKQFFYAEHHTKLESRNAYLQINKTSTMKILNDKLHEDTTYSEG